MNISWVCRSFNELNSYELYAIMQLRIEVFIVEQNCVFQDADNKDQQSHHLMGWNDEGKLVAYTRLVPANVSYSKASIGRVVISSIARRTGMGKELMLHSISTLYNIWGRQSIQIGAQLYLKRFYESLGFYQSSDIYMEDGIEHIEMIID